MSVSRYRDIIGQKRHYHQDLSWRVFQLPWRQEKFMTRTPEIKDYQNQTTTKEAMETNAVGHFKADVFLN